MNIHVAGFRGPWGWVNDFEDWISPHPHISITSPEDADVIFCCDPASSSGLENYLGKRKIIACVLDFADWLGGNESIEKYVNTFCKRADKVVGISDRVIGQLEDRGLKNVGMFYYPSQVGLDDLDVTIPKKRHLITFCRLGDPGKAIEESTKAFSNSELPENGWRYILVGQESPRFSLENLKGVIHVGYQDRQTLFNLVRSSKATMMPSYGEGLGLPAIESILLGTPSIIRNIEPCKSIVGESSIVFDNYDDLVYNLNNDLEDRLSNIELDTPKVRHWIRERAFRSLVELLGAAI